MWRTVVDPAPHQSYQPFASKVRSPSKDGHGKSRFTAEQIIGFVKQVEARMLHRKYGFSGAMFYKWRAKYGGMDVPDTFPAPSPR